MTFQFLVYQHHYNNHFPPGLPDRITAVPGDPKPAGIYNLSSVSWVFTLGLPSESSLSGTCLEELPWQLYRWHPYMLPKSLQVTPPDLYEQQLYFMVPLGLIIPHLITKSESNNSVEKLPFSCLYFYLCFILLVIAHSL